MPNYSIFCGVLLSLIAIVGGIVAYNDNPDKWHTALIPLAPGFLLILLGLLANWKENLRKHLMHAAVLVALLVVIGMLFAPGIKGVISTGQVSNWVSFTSQLATLFVSLSFVIASVKSFIAARKN